MTDSELLTTVKQAYWRLADNALLCNDAEGLVLRQRLQEAMQELLKRRCRLVKHESLGTSDNVVNANCGHAYGKYRGVEGCDFWGFFVLQP